MNSPAIHTVKQWYDLIDILKLIFSKVREHFQLRKCEECLQPGIAYNHYDYYYSCIHTLQSIILVTLNNAKKLQFRADI